MDAKELPSARGTTGLRSRRELGSFYMRRKENGDMAGVAPSSMNSTMLGVSSSAGDGKKFAPRRGASFIRPNHQTGAAAVSRNNQILDSFSKLSPAERQALVEDLERRRASAAGGRRSLPRPYSRSLEMEGSSSPPPGLLANYDKMIENPVEVSSRSNLSDFSDAEEVESEDLDMEAKEVGEEVEKWLNEGFSDQPPATQSEVGSAVTNDAVSVDCTKCAGCETYAKKVQAMESAMAKMQAEMAELRVKVKKSDKKSKGWGTKIGLTSSKSKKPPVSDDLPPTSVTSPHKSEVEKLRSALAQTRTKLEDTEMERDQYMQMAKMHLQQAIGHER
mmetsp:Transcript_4460/g.13528  ORF Transcript_4460/g.13528 Transcript_4460/m.13528 type:complete len:333 (+) Transcript_4460:149-1147(+)|eukprot:CAMPEP_0198723168 /NCGR_PEP_ID=MMETSP1475-20131203/714_1 /TAXON_ID= ORGANISM="Unidentified sp., Strain CCMP1999" /NCGR_SAMPLE_ID=MMETSP1475 /ASSEMBLY_ACC=CAM_ASM_001111 /LENGTH=332 /DNA_ID=CAMNT_0044484195 /DNA_START=106 /DNA_END=1104 /DNA_ORIENTATION=-